MTRAILVLACLLVLALALCGMWVGWRQRAERQASLGSLPPMPTGLGQLRLGPHSGLYVGTTVADRWQDRVVAAGLGRRATASASLHDSGVVIDREGEPPVFLPSEALVGARLGAGLAGKVTGAGGLLVLTWRLGDAVLDTGFRADDKASYPTWVGAIDVMVTAR
ncbi:MAG: transporter [Actinomycetota bacterium]